MSREWQLPRLRQEVQESVADCLRPISQKSQNLLRTQRVISDVAGICDFFSFFLRTQPYEAVKRLLTREEDSRMWKFISQSGLATAALDFTHDFSPLLVGLIGVVWLSAGLIVWVTIHHYLFQPPETVAGVLSPAEDRRDAA